MSVVVTNQGVFGTPPINRLAAMNQGNPLAPLMSFDHIIAGKGGPSTIWGGIASLFPHVQTPIGNSGQVRALPVNSGFSFPGGIGGTGVIRAPTATTNPLH